MYIYTYARLRFTRPRILLFQDEEMKLQRLDVIREVLAQSPVGSQDELRKKLRRRGIDVTQATLSRDIHTLQLVKGPKGYSLPHSGHGTAVAPEDDDTPPSIEEMLEGFGLRVRQAMNQVVLRTVMGGAQTTAAALDRAGWPEVIGTIAGDDTVLIICPDVRRAGEIEHRMRTLLES
jgi:transcriptional regulator of arginine metabolism